MRKNIISNRKKVLDSTVDGIPLLCYENGALDRRDFKVIFKLDS